MLAYSKQVYLNAEKKKKVNHILFVQKANSEMLFQLLPAAKRGTSACETLAGQKNQLRGYGDGLRHKGGVSSEKTNRKGNHGSQAWNQYLHIVWRLGGKGRGSDMLLCGAGGRPGNCAAGVPTGRTAPGSLAIDRSPIYSRQTQ